MTDDTDQAEELLQEAKAQSRHTSEPSTAPTETRAVDTVETIKEALLAIEDGDIPENINIRDARLKALLVGLQEADELETAASSLADTLEASPDIGGDTQSDVARLLIRVGLQEGLPDLLEDATEARKQAALEQASDF